MLAGMPPLSKNRENGGQDVEKLSNCKFVVNPLTMVDALRQYLPRLPLDPRPEGPH